MKKMKKLAALFLAVVMVMAMGMTAAAQEKSPDTVDDSNKSARITITNASKGETYSVYKLFDATVGTKNPTTGETPISYKGEIPETLKAYFTKDAAGNISAVKATAVSGNNIVSADLQTALATWASNVTPIVTEVSDGTDLNFVDLPYGYYVVTTSLGAQALTVTSTMPTANVIDKNIKEPTVDSENGKVLTDAEGNKLDAKDVSIGQTVYYTLKFTASNFENGTEDAKKIASYVVHDDLPRFLGTPVVDSIWVNKGAIENGTKTNVEYKNLDETKVTAFTRVSDDDYTITLAWVDGENASRYLSGAEVVIRYHATVTNSAAIDGEGNTNTFRLTYTDVTGGIGEPSKNTSTETIYTYALAIKKVDENLEPLPGAQFKVAGLMTQLENANVPGVYVVTNGEAAVGSETQMSTDNNGILIIKGVKLKEYKVTEEVAPDGYNKLETYTTVTPVKTSETTTDTIVYLDENGNVTSSVTDSKVTYTNDNLAATVLPIVNHAGAVLPSTGGIGTTIFYVVGGILVLGAGVLLITKKRMSAK